ncbi:hypothetical protein ASE63_15660 [Bosea sp. Root381]|uniref:hypothetical protein n=1 Tax=Bosea sp. Root381 TaxID=1736524 RepID=UPI0006FB3A76|nr:hypothetical protein [Bosea sp. Root381]KRE15690.1 hypothetical protein ASE63_15660 [Bosea sp. Root381]
MSLVDLRHYAALLDTSPADSFDPLSDDEALTPVEMQDVRTILSEVAARLADRSGTIPGARRRLGAIVEALISVADAIDGDCEDEGAQCEDEGGQCDDEGAPDDNGLADADGLKEQGFALRVNG